MDNAFKRAKQILFDPRLPLPILWAGIFTTLIALALYGYLGTFSRYGSDDYCLSAFYLQEGDFIARIIQRYMNASSRYTNILFIGLVDNIFGWYNVAILPPLMIALFVAGVFLFLKEIVQSISLGWNRSLTFLLAILMVYFSIMKAPDLYETLYWRAGMTSHFAPLVFLTYLGAFVIRQIRLVRERNPAIWTLILCFVAAFLIGGFSEPPVAMLVTVLVLAILVVWFWSDTSLRRPRTLILFWTLAGAILALAVLALAPANAIRLGTPPPGLIELILRTFKYPFEFIVDIFRSLPVPTLFTFILPGIIFYVRHSSPDGAFSGRSQKQIGMLLIVASAVSYLLIAASFAPSVYGQSFPVPRARLTGVVILTCALMINGALIGILFANIIASTTPSPLLRHSAILLLMLLTLYPLRTASRMTAEIPVYQQRALAWDGRDEKIRALAAGGERDLRIPFLSGEIIQDLGDRTEFRLNRCASMIYGVDSILALPMDVE
jgi:hypothetical protein